MKNVLFLVDSPLDSNIRALKTIRSLSKNFKVHVIHRGVLEANSIYYDIEHITYQKLPLNITNFFVRTFFLGNDFTRAIQKLDLDSFLEFDLIYAVDLWTLPAASLLSKKNKSKLVYDSYEICAETIVQHYPRKGNFVKVLFFRFWIWLTRLNAIRIERSHIKVIDLFITTNNSYSSYFKEKYGVSEIEVVMNCPYMDSADDNIDLYKTYNIPTSKKILLYIGWFNGGRMLESIVEASKYIKSDTHILLLGQGVLKAELSKRINYLSNVSIAGPYKMIDNQKLIKGSDAGILLLEKSNVSKYLASANKVFDFLMADKMMILSKSPENEWISKLNKNFEILGSYNIVSIANCIDDVMAKDTRSIVGDSLLKNKFSWEHQERILLDAIDKTLI